ncbi:hypothetical protein WJX74_008190 [Apatococcus lobatus]|uniref:Uncharacterized protein n=1 Tax=Apatococcus lobatus TaxID=904363 RepID=A0AAW1RT22_9CHLO
MLHKDGISESHGLININGCFKAATAALGTSDQMYSPIASTVNIISFQFSLGAQSELDRDPLPEWIKKAATAASSVARVSLRRLQ